MKKDRQDILNFKSVPSDRMESFSDAFIAIIITLMVLEIPLPKSMAFSELLAFGKSVTIYFASFIIVGIQWNKHHLLFRSIKMISRDFIWKNMLCLFFISLIPVFMKWLLEYPTSLIPAIAYSAVYLLNEFGMRWLFWSHMKEDTEWLKANAYTEPHSPGFSFIFILSILIFAIIMVLSVFHPETAIVCFVVFPVVMSLRNIFTVNEDKKRIAGGREPVRRIGTYK